MLVLAAPCAFRFLVSLWVEYFQQLRPGESTAGVLDCGRGDSREGGHDAKEAAGAPVERGETVSIMIQREAARHVYTPGTGQTSMRRSL